MRVTRQAMEQPRVFILGLSIGAGLIVIGFLLATTTVRGVLATHDGNDNIHACVRLQNGQTRIVLPGETPNCTSNEVLVEWPSTALTDDMVALQDLVATLQVNQAALEAEVSTLRGELAALQAEMPNCLSTEGDDVIFEGCNVHVRNGADATDTTNGLGNLIIGYNENSQDFSRTGSHNLVVGTDHGYTSFGGLVAGFQNVISGQHSSVSGGFNNTASGTFSSVSGGRANSASGSFGSSISGGTANQAIGPTSSISGGAHGIASGGFSSVSGGSLNIASGSHSSVSGGIANEASGDLSTVSGGQENTAGHLASTVGGTRGSQTTAANQWIAGSLTEPS